MVVALAVVLVVAHGASTALGLRHSYDRTIGDAGASLESIAASAEIGTANRLFEIDAMLIGIGRILTAFPGTPLDAPAVKTVLGEFNRQSLAVSDILILDQKGQEMNRANRIEGSAGNYANRSFFTAFRGGASETLFIGTPKHGSPQRPWSIWLSRALVRDGVAIGVIAAEVPIASFADFYGAIATDRRTTIALLSDGGVLLADVPRRTATIGAVPVFAAALAAAAIREKSGLLSASTDEDGHKALRAFRELPGRSLIVTAARTRAKILAGWYEECRTALLGFTVFAATVAALAWLAVRALRRAQFATAYLRRGEARLRRQTLLLQSILENIDEGLSVFDGRGRLIARNQRFCELLDLPADVPFGVALADILMRQAVRGDFGDTEARIEVASRLNRFYHQIPVVKERLTLAGRTLQIRRRAMPDGAVLSIYSDITEIKASERKIVQARSQAEMANRSKSEFLANMSHELRTPLNAIIGFSEIISGELFGAIANEKYLEYMKDIHASSLHLLSIINDVLDMSKIEAGKFELSKERIAIGRIIADVVRLMHERAGSRGIALVQCLGNDDVTIWADERAMRQILLNLLSNAIKFSTEGGSVIVRLAAGAGVVLEVEDHGIGMNEAEQKRALQPFGQAKPATTRDYGGTGLGLPITKGLVEAHGGTLIIISRAGKGTIVRVVIPSEPASFEAGSEPLVWPYPMQIE